MTKERVQLPNGLIIDDFYKVRVSDAAAVVALTEDNQIILKREFRYCYGKELIELPSGIFEAYESDPLVVAKRELSEETGYASDDWTYLGGMIENSAKLTNTIHLFLARNCREVTEQHLDRTEEITVIRMQLKEAVEMVMDNRICCSCTAQGVLKVARYYGL